MAAALESEEAQFAQLELLLDAVKIDDKFNAIEYGEGDDVAMRYWNDFKDFAPHVMREIGFAKEVYDLKKTSAKRREWGLEGVRDFERVIMNRIYKKYVRVADALEEAIEALSPSPFRALIILHKKCIKDAAIEAAARRTGDSDSVFKAAGEIVKCHNFALQNVRKIGAIPYAELISKTPTDSTWLLPYFAKSSEDYKKQWKDDFDELKEIFTGEGNSLNFIQHVAQMQYKYTHQDEVNLRASPKIHELLTAFAESGWPIEKTDAVQAAWQDAYTVITAHFIDLSGRYEDFKNEHGPYVPHVPEFEPKELKIRTKRMEGLRSVFTHAVRKKPSKEKEKAVAEYQNMMNIDDLYDGLRDKSHHYRHNNDFAHLHGDYLGYSRGDLAPAHFEGYDQQSSSVVDFEAILSVTMLFFIGFAICCIWWLCCAVSGYFLHTKKLHNAKKENDIERQCIYSSH